MKISKTLEKTFNHHNILMDDIKREHKRELLIHRIIIVLLVACVVLAVGI